MIEQEKIKTFVEEFFDKMTITATDIKVDFSIEKNNIKDNLEDVQIINLDVKTEDPQILIGQQGQTLLEIQRILRMVLSKKLGEPFYLNLDIDGYKKKKIEYLKYLAKDSADYVVSKNEEKVLPPMSAYERRIIHAELSQRDNISTESAGVGEDRHIIIKPK